MVSVGNIRESVAAGTFYPGNADVLRTQINDFLSNAKSEDIKNIKSIICPHAGYIYSGQVAAHSYKQIKGGTFDSIFIIAPSHAEYFDFISIFNGDAYRTPLGLVYVDKERSRILADKNPRIELSKYGHRTEHSLEVQLPFLQVLFEDIKIVPIVMGQQNDFNIKELGNTIGNLFKNDKILSYKNSGDITGDKSAVVGYLSAAFFKK